MFENMTAPEIVLTVLIILGFVAVVIFVINFINDWVRVARLGKDDKNGKDK